MSSDRLRGAGLGVGALILIAGLCNCGVKGPPQPPPLPVPGAPEKFEARVRESCIELSWRAPKVEPPERVEAVRYEVLRAREPASDQEPAFLVIDRITGTSYTDCSLSLEARAVYQVRGISAEGRRGEPTAMVRAVNLDPPLAPTGLRTLAGDGFVELFWETPPDMPAEARYNIYRALEAAVFPARPVNPEPIKETYWADGPLDNGVRYFYEIRAVITVEGHEAVEGPAGFIVTAVPADRVPPSAPQSLLAVWKGDGVWLTWLRNQEPDLLGYIVWRRRRGMGEFKELFLDPILETSYLDQTARPGVEYEYVVTALDRSQPPNVSPRSELQVIYIEP